MYMHVFHLEFTTLRKGKRAEKIQKVIAQNAEHAIEIGKRKLTASNYSSIDLLCVELLYKNVWCEQ